MHFSGIIFIICALFVTDALGQNVCLIANEVTQENDEIPCNQCNAKCLEYHPVFYHGSQVLRFGSFRFCYCPVLPEEPDCVFHGNREEFIRRSECFDRCVLYRGNSWPSIGGVCKYTRHGPEGHMRRFDCQCFP